MNNILASLKTSLQIRYNRFILQLVTSLCLPLVILNLTTESEFLFLRFLVVLMLIFSLDLVIYKICSKKHYEFSALLYASVAFLFLPMDASFALSAIIAILSLAFKHIQGGFGKIIIHPSLLAILTLYIFNPNAFALVSINDQSLVYLTLISCITVIIVLQIQGFLALIAILGFFIAMAPIIILFDGYSLKGAMNLFLNRGTLILLGGLILLGNPILGLKNNFISLFLGTAGAIFLSALIIFMPFNAALATCLLMLNFVRYFIMAKAKEKGYIQ